MLTTAAAYYPVFVWVDGAPVDPAGAFEQIEHATLDQNVIVRVFRDGLFAFDFSQWSPGLPTTGSGPSDAGADMAILRRVELLHAHLICLYTAILHRDHWTPQEWIIVSAADGIFLPSIDDDALMPIRYPPHHDRLTASLQAVRDSLDLLNTMLRQTTDVVQIADLFLRVNHAYRVFDYNVCLATGWTLSEKILRELWMFHLQSAGGMTSSLMKKTAAFITKSLLKANRLPPNLGQRLDAVRDARNDWLHGLKRGSSDDAREAIVLSKQMILFAYNINLEMNLLQISHY